ncbi:MAG TPA: hypothetical protein VGI18_12360 [Burkholderiales bacterium]|jgi:hypothetical protein
MNRFALPLCLALIAPAASAQKANTTQVEAVSAVAECLAVGLPKEWKQFQVVVDIRRPYADTGGVLYLVTLPDGRTVPFEPCDPRVAPSKLVGLRELQSDSEQGWTKVTLTMKPDASFDLKYEYPPKKPGGG